MIRTILLACKPAARGPQLDYRVREMPASKREFLACGRRINCGAQDGGTDLRALWQQTGIYVLRVMRWGTSMMTSAAKHRAALGAFVR